MRCTGAPNGTCLSDADVSKVRGYINPLMLDRRVVGAPWSGITNLANVVPSSIGLGSGFLALAFRSATPVNPLTYDIANQFDDVAAVLDGVYSMTGDLDGIVKYLRRGKKLILFHGWEDPVVPAYVSVNFFKALDRADDDAARNSRLYMAPGVQHCGGGNGADSVDLLTTLTRWVENNERRRLPCQSNIGMEASQQQQPSGHRRCVVLAPALSLPRLSAVRRKGRREFGAQPRLSPRSEGSARRTLRLGRSHPCR